MDFREFPLGLGFSAIASLFRGDAPASAFDELHDPEGQKRFVPDWGGATKEVAITFRSKAKTLMNVTATLFGRIQ